VLALLAAQAEGQEAGSAAPSQGSSLAKCRYGPSGKLVFSPRGTNATAATPPSSQPAVAVVAPKAAAPSPATAEPQPAKRAAQPTVAVMSRNELVTLLAERERLLAELGRIREAMTLEDRESARRVIEASLALIARHLEHEERVLEPLTTGKR
jgi:hypothetical protein